MPHNQPKKVTCGYESDASSVPERNAPVTREENHPTQAKSKKPPSAPRAEGEMMDFLKLFMEAQRELDERRREETTEIIKMQLEQQKELVDRRAELEDTIELEIGKQ